LEISKSLIKPREPKIEYQNNVDNILSINLKHVSTQEDISIYDGNYRGFKLTASNMQTARLEAFTGNKRRSDGFTFPVTPFEMNERLAWNEITSFGYKIKRLPMWRCASSRKQFEKLCAVESWNFHQKTLKRNVAKRLFSDSVIYKLQRSKKTVVCMTESALLCTKMNNIKQMHKIIIPRDSWLCNSSLCQSVPYHIRHRSWWQPLAKDSFSGELSLMQLNISCKARFSINGGFISSNCFMKYLTYLHTRLDVAELIPKGFAPGSIYKRGSVFNDIRLKKICPYRPDIRYSVFLPTSKHSCHMGYSRLTKLPNKYLCFWSSAEFPILSELIATQTDSRLGKLRIPCESKTFLQKSYEVLFHTKKIPKTENEVKELRMGKHDKTANLGLSHVKVELQPAWFIINPVRTHTAFKA